MTGPKVHLFWDNSNIFISAQSLAVDRNGLLTRQALRIHFSNLYNLAVAGRPVGKAIAVGSIPPDQKELWERLAQDTGIQTELYERGESSGTEQGIDQCLQTHMLRSLVDAEGPQIAVLLTGDGKGYDDGVGFHADLERMYKIGWGIEVLSWERSCKKTLKQWATSVGVYVLLDQFYDSITFLDGTRRSKNLSLTHRPLAQVSLDVSPEIEPDALTKAQERALAAESREAAASAQLAAEREVRARLEEQVRRLKAERREDTETKYRKKQQREEQKRRRKK